jgi:hypothetical protein
VRWSRERRTVVRDATHAAFSSLTNRRSGGSVHLRFVGNCYPRKTNKGTLTMQLLPTILALALAAPSLAEAGSKRFKTSLHRARAMRR